MFRFKIAKMSCGHCVASIEKAIRGVDSQAAVSVDLDRKEIAIRSIAEERLISGALRSAGYEGQAPGA